MPRPRIDLEPWKATITDWIHRDNYDYTEIMAHLLADGGLSVSRATLARNLKDWGIGKSAPTIPRLGPEREDLENRARFFFTKLGLQDKRAAVALRNEGHSIGTRALSSLRRDMGLYRRVPADEQDRAANEIREALLDEFRIGRINRYGRRHLASHMRRHYNTHCRSVLSQSLPASKRMLTSSTITGNVFLRLPGMLILWQHARAIRRTRLVAVRSSLPARTRNGL